MALVPCSIEQECAAASQGARAPEGRVWCGAQDGRVGTTSTPPLGPQVLETPSGGAL